MYSMTQPTWSGKNKQEATKNNKKTTNLSQRAKLIQTNQFTIRKICHLAGMANQFPTGSTSFMGWVSNTSARFVEITVIGAGGHSKCTFKSGDIPTAWSVSVFRTLSISRTWLQLMTPWHSTKNWWTRLRKPSLGQKNSKNSKTHKATSSIVVRTTTWKNKEFSDIYLEMRPSSKLIPPSLC